MQVEDVITSVTYEVKDNPILSTGSTLGRQPRLTPPKALYLNQWIVVKADQNTNDKVKVPFWVGKVLAFTATGIKLRWYSGSGVDLERFIYTPAPLPAAVVEIQRIGPDAVCILDSGFDIMTKKKTLKALCLKRIADDDRVEFTLKARNCKKSKSNGK